MLGSRARQDEAQDTAFYEVPRCVIATKNTLVEESDNNLPFLEALHKMS
jgi:hypothetical protein